MNEWCGCGWLGYNNNRTYAPPHFFVFMDFNSSKIYTSNKSLGLCLIGQEYIDPFSNINQLINQVN